MKDKTVAIEHTPSKNIASDFEETVSAHTNLAKTLNVKEELKKNASAIPKSDTLANVNHFSTDHVDAVDRNIITDQNNSNPKKISRKYSR